MSNQVLMSRGSRELTSTPKTLAAITSNSRKIIKKPYTRLKASQNIKLEKLPLLKNCTPVEFEDIFIQKLRQCCVLFDFITQPLPDLKSNEMKTATLNELIEFVSLPHSVIPENVYPEIIKMLAANLFHTFPPISYPQEFDAEEDEPTLEASWPHLQLVYEFFIAFLLFANFSQDIAEKFIDEKFVKQLLQLFDSEDPRERYYLKITLHKIYNKFFCLRQFIRKELINIFSCFTYESKHHNGVGELLDVLSCIINGLALPLKEEHQIFLLKVLLPLHKVNSLFIFQWQLTLCITKFINKAPTLAVPVINALLKYWPKAHSSKEVIFLTELEEIIGVTDTLELKILLVPMFRQLSKCITSPHYQVAERVLAYLHNEHILATIRSHSYTVIPIIFPSLYKNTEHWNKTICTLSNKAIKLLTNINERLVAQCTKKYERDKLREYNGIINQEDSWPDVDKLAEKNSFSKQLLEQR